MPADAASPQGRGLTPTPDTGERAQYILRSAEPLGLKVCNARLPSLPSSESSYRLPLTSLYPALRRRNCDYGGDITGVGAVPYPRGWQLRPCLSSVHFFSRFIPRARAHYPSLLALLLSHRLVSIYRYGLIREKNYGHLDNLFLLGLLPESR